jgi:CHAT domain-containing protein
MVAWTRQVLAQERVEIASILDGPHQKNLQRLAQDMEDSLRIYGRSLLRKLHSLCIAPIQDHITGCHNLLIVPAGAMCLIPWAALMDRRGRYLLEAHALRVVPCLEVLARIHATLDSAAVSTFGRQRSATAPGTTRLAPQLKAAVVGDPFPISHTFGSGVSFSAIFFAFDC